MTVISHIGMQIPHQHTLDVLVEPLRKTHKNIKTIKELDELCFPGIAPPVFGPRKTFCWVVRQDSEIIAYAIGCKVQNLFFLSRAGVSPEHRGKNIQRLLIETRIEKANEMKLDGVVTYTSKNNIASIKNIRSCGLRQCPDIPEWIGIDDTEFIYWKLDFNASAPIVSDLLQ